MTLIQPGYNLRSLILLPQPAVPETLLGYLASREELPTQDGRYICESELHTRLYFYDLVLNRDVSAVPANVIDEIRQNRLACLALLLQVQWLLGAAKSAPGVVRQLLSDEMAPLSPELCQLVTAQIIQLLLEELDEPLLEAIEDAKELLQFDESSYRIVRLARAVIEFDENQPQAAIAILRKLATEMDASGVASQFLLARIYQRLNLPYHSCPN